MTVDEPKLLSKFSSIRQGNLNRFYTRDVIGKLITNEISAINPINVIDLGAGEGSLSVAVSKHWPQTNIVTVDIDPECIDDLHTRITEHTAAKHDHHIHDVLNTDFSIALKQYGGFDLAVCNPPFYKPEWQRNFSDILRQADLADACQSTADVTAEILFLAQNLSLVNDGGTIALIAPDGLLTGWRTVPLRRILLSNHSVDCVMQLPRHSFHDTEARCFVLFLRKKAGPTNQVKLLRYDAVSGLSEPLLISPEQAEKRMDYEYHVNGTVHGEHLSTLRQLGADVIRGSISTVEAKGADFPIFHTTDYNKAEDGNLSLASAMPELNRKRLIIAEPGDILMARVDRNLHQKVAMVVSGKAALTDCVYRVRLPANVRNAAFEALRSIEGATKLRAISKGVSARLLGKADLLDLPLPIAA